MARLPRVVVADVAHHVTQRGNARQVIFDSDSGRRTYLELLRQHCELYQLSLLGYCLMSNHVHLIAIPRTAQSLSQALQQKRWTAAEWIGYLAAGESSAEVTELRRFTHTGRPLGNAAFVAELEQSTSRRLTPRKRGRRQKPAASEQQHAITFVLNSFTFPFQSARPSAGSRLHRR